VVLSRSQVRCQANGLTSRPNGPQKRVFGVRAVANDIGLNLTSKRTDPEIARDVVQKLENHILIPSDKIKVTVRDGWVMLEGEVRWQFQRKLAESAVRGTDGVAGISNTITIKTNVSRTKSQRPDRSHAPAECGVGGATQNGRGRGEQSHSPRRRRPME